MHISGKYSWIKHLDFLAIDLFSLLIAFHVGYYLKFRTLAMNSEWRRFILIVVLLNIIIYLIANPYSGIFRRRYYMEIGRCFLMVAWNAVSATLIFYVLKIGADYSREVVILTFVIDYFLSLVLKYIWKKLLITGKISSKTTKRTPLFLISTRENAEKDIHSIYSTDMTLYEIKGVYLTDHAEGDHPDAYQYADYNEIEVIPVIGDDFIDFVFANNINEVIAAVPLNTIDITAYRKLIENGINVDLVIETLLGLQTEEQFVTSLGVNKTLSVGLFSFSPSQSFYLLVKRVFDVFCGLIGMVILIPVTVLVKIANLLSGDTAKIFYRQKRVGMNGKQIRIWKYRTMVPNADEILKELLKEEKYRKEWEENQKLEDDPRITKVGRFLRKTSVDELPQLLNVLMGDMSLVGPRPLVEGELFAHNGLKLYERVKPGITGWWGCNGRSNIDYRERLELEYYYVKNCSLYLDILCIIRTVYAVLSKDGAQ